MTVHVKGFLAGRVHSSRKPIPTLRQTVCLRNFQIHGLIVQWNLLSYEDVNQYYASVVIAALYFVNKIYHTFSY
jgi:hypothetical protein